jgi:hypothetical protein
MELSMSGGALRTFSRCVTCLARIGSELVFQAYPDKVRRRPSQPPNPRSARAILLPFCAAAAGGSDDFLI